MFCFFLFSLISSQQQETESSVKCPYNNTESTADGMCVCLPGYVSDPNNISLGCWKCNEKCHRLATCVYPGKCECNNGLNGTGLICSTPIPIHFQRVSLKALEEGGFYLEIRHEGPEEYTVPIVYIQIGSVIVKAKTFTDKIAEFDIPDSISGFQNVTISYDRLNWANEIKLWYFEKTMNNLFIAESTPFVFALVIVVLIGTCLLHGKQIIFEKEESSQTTDSILTSPTRAMRNE